MNLLSRVCYFAIFLLVGVNVSTTLADELPNTVVLDGLDNPTAVAVQPDTGTVFIAESGAGRVVRLSKTGDSIEPVVIGFSQDEDGNDPTDKIGPLGLAFIDKNTLVIGGGGRPDGEDRIYVVTVPDPGADPIKANDAPAFEPITATSEDELAATSDGDFFSVVVMADQVYTTANGDDQTGWIARGKLDGNKPGGVFERFLATTEKAKVNTPAALTKTPRDELLVGQMGVLDEQKDSLITFYNPADGKILLNLKTDLYDIISLKYGPEKQPYDKSHLYALDYAWSNPQSGRLVRLDAILNEDGSQEVKSITLASLVHPTSMAFGPDGELYVTLLSSTDNANQADGKLIRFEPGL